MITFAYSYTWYFFMVPVQLRLKNIFFKCIVRHKNVFFSSLTGNDEPKLPVPLSVPHSSGSSGRVANFLSRIFC
jgi:hypothetical protein